MAIVRAESAEAFICLLKSLLELCAILGIADPEHKIEFVMIDKCQASRKAIDEVLPYTTVLHCYFHVMHNSKKKKGILLSENSWTFIYRDINNMAACTSLMALKAYGNLNGYNI